MNHLGLIARKEVPRESDAFDHPEHHVERLSLAGGLLAPQQEVSRKRAVRLGHPSS
jgi:hypothetical protein